MGRISAIVGIILMLVGIILVLDQLWLLGIPFGGFLGDLSGLDPTGSPVFHHWMLGVVLIVAGYFAAGGRV